MRADAAPLAGPAPAAGGGAPWWPVLVCGSLVLALSIGARQVSGLFLAPVMRDLGLGADAFGAAVAVQNLVWGLAQPVAGLLADRLGARPVVAACGLLYAAGLALAAGAGNATGLFLGLGVLCGLGQAGTAFAVVLAVVGRAAPPERRAFAVGLGSTAGSFGLFVLVPLAGAGIAAFDWRPTLAAMACLLALTPLLGLALGEPRRTQGLGHGGVTAGEAARAACADRDFWLLNLGFATCGFQLAFVATYLPVTLAGAGLGAAAGGLVLGTIGLANIPGTYLAGLAGGRWRKSRVLACVYLARAAAILLFLAAGTTSLAGGLLFGVAIGLLWTGTVPLTSGLVADLWGRRHLGFLFGLVYVGHQLGAFAGAWAGGLALDRTGGLDPVWAATVLVSLTAAACHLALVERPRAAALAEA